MQVVCKVTTALDKRWEFLLGKASSSALSTGLRKSNCKATWNIIKYLEGRLRLQLLGKIRHLIGTAKGDLFASLLAGRRVPASPEPFAQHPASVKSQALGIIPPQAWAAGEEVTITHFQDLATQESTGCPSRLPQTSLPAVQAWRQKAWETGKKRAAKLRTWLGSSLSWWAGRSSSCRATVTCRNHRGWGAAGPASLWNSGSSSGALCGCNVSEDKQSGKRRITH